MGKVFESNHALLKDKMTRLRDKDTKTKEFGELVNEITTIMAYEITSNLKLKDKEVETPLVKTVGKVLSEELPIIVPVLRAGLGMVDGFRTIMPELRVGHIGLFRNEETLEPVEYYCKLPNGIESSTAIVVDPMLATGGSAEAAILFLKQRGVVDIKLACILGCPEGIAKIQKVYPEIDIYIGHIDERLNEKGYILPGLGDAGDRIFGTK